MWPFNIIKQHFTKKPDNGYDEAYDLIRKLWPWDISTYYEMRLADKREWLNARTGLNVPPSASISFHHWLPRLRQMASEIND